MLNESSSKRTEAQQSGSAARPATLAARGPSAHRAGPVNTPVHRASTILYETVAAYEARREGFYEDVTYGLYGTETTFAFADAVATLEGGHKTVVTSSGTAAIALGLIACAKAGDHVLVADTVYGTTRRFCDEYLRRFGIEVTYFDPLDVGHMSAHLRRNTAAVYLEVPGSHTFEMIDVPKVAAMARSQGALTLIDNTWATPLFFQPLKHGVDISIQSGTKYFSGHSDLLLGTLTAASAEVYERLKDAAGRFGNCASPDDCYLAHRGLRTLDVRLRRHEANARRLIDWLLARNDVRRVLYPGIPSDPGHALWRRDFQGASGLFGVLLDPAYAPVRAAFFENLEWFRIGSSWGGYESLMVPAAPAPVRSHRPAPADGFLVRIHAGLEDADDLIADLELAFERVRAASAVR
jgi:cysteine-S-conjugate beta-lyase